MIEAFNVDTSLGKDDQVGLFIRADEQMARRFRRLLWHEGLNSVPLMPSKVSGYSYFTYVSAPNQHATSVEQQLHSLCQAHSTTPVSHVDYNAWHAAFNAYVETYRIQHIARSDTRPAHVFDKSRAYKLIQNGSYAEAKTYLSHFAIDNPPNLVPAYLVYLYHQWRRPEDVVQIHARYTDQLQAGDVDHRVIEWVVAAYLNLSPPEPDQALMVLADFLPEFQRQGVAEQLLAFRAQARALQGQLPQTPAELRLYLQHTLPAALTEQLDDLLDVVAGLPAPAEKVEELLDTLFTKVEASRRWRVMLAQGDLAQRNKNFERALTCLQTVLAKPPAKLDKAGLGKLRLKLADLYLQLSQPNIAADTLTAFTPEELSEGEQQAYWQLLGQALAQVGAPTALDALQRAYELGSRQPDFLQSLARLAYQTEDWELARRVYDELLQTSFEPRPEDRLYAGILAWLSGQPNQAAKYLQELPDMLHDTLPANALALAYEALVDSLETTVSPPDQLVNALSVWTDWLTTQQDLNGITSLVTRIVDVGFDRLTMFALLEPLELVLAEHKPGKELLVQTYTGLIWAEVDEALRHERPLPAYTLELRRGLSELDRAQFNFVQEYLQEELVHARDADLVAADFDTEPVAEPPLDLSERWIALVGGYAPVRRRVRERLVQGYNLGRFTEVPPSWEAHIDQARVAEAVRGADLIVVVHRCIKHDGTDALKAATNGTEAENRIRYAPGKGQSSVVRTIQEYFGN